MGATGHLSVQQGTPVVIHFKEDGSVAARAKFIERQARRIIFEGENGVKFDVPTNKIRTLSIYKPKEQP